MSIAHLYLKDSSGDWSPALSNGPAAGLGGGGGGGQSSAPWSYAAASGGITNTSDVTLAAAAGIGLSNYITNLQVMNSSSTATEVVIKDGSTVIWRALFGGSMIQPVSIDLNLASSQNTALKAACITTSTVTYVNAQGFVDASPSGRQAAASPYQELQDDSGNFIFDNNSNNAQLYTQ